MKPSEIAQSIELLISQQLNPFVSGPPGVGKSQVIYQVADKLGYDLRIIHLSQMDPVDLRGIPYVTDGTTRWAIPDFLPAESDRKVMLFFDEYLQSNVANQNASSQILLERRLGDWVMPRQCVAIAASNNQGDRAATTKLPTHIASRFVHLEFEVDRGEWTQHARRNDFAFEVISLIQLKEDLLHDFDPKRDEKTFPCPRTWFFVSEMFKANPPEHLENALYSGAVGKGAAAAFLAFLKVYKNLPSIDGIIADPDGAPIPSAPEVLYAVCGTLARRTTTANWTSIARYLGRLPKEFGVCLVTEAVKRCPDIQSTRAFGDWQAQNPDWSA
jgi:hypothetical protein